MSLVRTCLIPATRSLTRSLGRQACPVTPIAVRRLATATTTAGQTQPTTSNGTRMMSSFLAPLAGWSPAAMRLASPFLDTGSLASRRGILDFDTLLNRPVSIHLEEKDNEYIITIQAQGLKKEELDINVDGDMLVISGQHTERRERRRGVEEAYVSFQRVVGLPEDVDVDNIRAEYDDKGNLCRVHLPKKPQEQQPRRGRINIEGTGTGTGSSTLGMGTTGTTEDATGTGTTATGTATSTATGQKYTV